VAVPVATGDHDPVVYESGGDEISVKRRDLIEVFRQLEFLVVSLDHIESAFRDSSADEEAHAIRRFIADWGVLSRVSEARFILDAYFSRELGPDGMSDLERELRDMRFWSWSEPTPVLAQSGPKQEEPKQ
jgi:hypothetical protein